MGAKQIRPELISKEKIKILDNLCRELIIQHKKSNDLEIKLPKIIMTHGERKVFQDQILNIYSETKYRISPHYEYMTFTLPLSDHPNIYANVCIKKLSIIGIGVIWNDSRHIMYSKLKFHKSAIYSIFRSRIFDRNVLRVIQKLAGKLIKKYQQIK